MKLTSGGSPARSHRRREPRIVELEDVELDLEADLEIEACFRQSAQRLPVEMPGRQRHRRPVGAK